MEEINKKIEQIITEQNEIKILISKTNVSKNWINKETACAFLGYENSQFSTLIKERKLEYSRIGRRIFISIKSLEKLLDSNKVF
jgi:hypothetical protein